MRLILRKIRYNPVSLLRVAAKGRLQTGEAIRSDDFNYGLQNGPVPAYVSVTVEHQSAVSVAGAAKVRMLLRNGAELHGL